MVTHISVPILNLIYIRMMIDKFRLEDAAVVSTSADSHGGLKKPDSRGRNDGTFPYREAMGSLMFAPIVARSDIILATNEISRYT